MTAAVVIPFAGDDPHRVRALHWIRDRYQSCGLAVHIGKGNPDAWSKADAVADALDDVDADLLIIADADVWAPDLGKAVGAVQDGRTEWAIPHRRVHRLTPVATRHVIDGDLTLSDCRAWDERPYVGIIGGGVVVVTVELYGRVPLDRRFIGWGGEDNAWGYALQTIAGSPVRYAGPLWHLWHPPQPRPRRARGSAANEQLRTDYRSAQVDVDRMRELVEAGR
jgi:hypothetical protein